MKRTVQTLTCEYPTANGSCGFTQEYDLDRSPQAASTDGWRVLELRLSGEPYPEFSGDVCPKCVEMVRAVFRTRERVEAAQIVAGAGKLIGGMK